MVGVTLVIDLGVSPRSNLVMFKRSTKKHREKRMSSSNKMSPKELSELQERLEREFPTESLLAKLTEEKIISQYEFQEISGSDEKNTLLLGFMKSKTQQDARRVVAMLNKSEEEATRSLAIAFQRYYELVAGLVPVSSEGYPTVSTHTCGCI